MFRYDDEKVRLAGIAGEQAAKAGIERMCVGYSPAEEAAWYECYDREINQKSRRIDLTPPTHNR